jgi:hypothetical protein
LKRLADMIQTAVEHAEAARRAEKEFGQPETAAALGAEPNPPQLAAESGKAILEAGAEGPVPELQTEMKIAPTTATPVEPQDGNSTLASAEVGATSELVGESLAETDLSRPITTIAFGNLRRCETCGFPVSEGRRLCLDCEAATPDAVASVSNAPEFFGQLDDANPSWVRSHAYLVATALIAAATIALLVWRF